MDMADRQMELILMCPLSNVLIYSFAACIFVSCFQGAESMVPTISVTSDNPGLNCGTDVVLECIITGPYDHMDYKVWRGPPSNTLLIVDGSKYIEDITNAEITNKYTLAVSQFSLSDVGAYTCEYGFDGRSIPVTCNYECFSTSSLMATLDNGVIVIQVDKVYPDIPTTTLCVTVTDSSNTAVPGAVTSMYSTSYYSHFLLTWSSTSSTVADGSYTYNVGITTSIGGTEASFATGASATCTYSAIASIPRGDETVIEGAPSKDLTCVANSKPAATFTWYKGTSSTALASGPGTGSGNRWTSTYTIVGVDRSHAGRYRCVAGNGVGAADEKTMTLTVYFPPLSATIEGNRVIEADGHNKLLLNCVVGESNPISAVTWSKTGTVDIGTTQSSQDATGSYGGYTRSQVLELTPTRGNDGDTITCTAGNVVGQSVTHTITLNLKFSAIASFPHGDETVIEGAPSKELTCNANSKPHATFTWYKGTSSTALASGPTTGSGNGWTSTYTIVGVDRSHAGRYRCVADNGIGAADEKTMTLTVYYPPDVTVTVQDRQETYGQVVATCLPVGVPNFYTYSSWVHLWSDGTLISQPQVSATQPLALTGLTYQDSGIYTCGAGNGVGLFGAMSAGFTREGSTSVITIESPPMIIGPAEQRVPIKLHEPTTVSITYYSNVAGSTVTCHRVVNNIRQSQSVGVVTSETSTIQLPVYGSVVSEQGTSATVMLILNTAAELGAYVVKITNTIGMVIAHLLAVAEGPPAMPIDPRVEDVYTTSVIVSWELDYHGGPGQIFIIQYSTDGETWTDGATLDTGNSTSRDRHYVTVDSLSPGTLYSLRIHAYNHHGLSPYTDVINVATPAIGADNGTLPSAVGPAMGGSAGALVAIALVVGLVVLHRKGYSIMRPCKKKSNTYRDHTYENEVETNETRHEMYQARASSTTQDEGQAAALPYESLATTRVTTSTIYDELNVTGLSEIRTRQEVENERES